MLTTPSAVIAAATADILRFVCFYRNLFFIKSIFLKYFPECCRIFSQCQPLDLHVFVIIIEVHCDLGYIVSADRQLVGIVSCVCQFSSIFIQHYGHNKMIFRENIIYRKLHRRDFDSVQPEARCIRFAYLYDLHFLIALGD